MAGQPGCFRLPIALRLACGRERLPGRLPAGGEIFIRRLFEPGVRGLDVLSGDTHEDLRQPLPYGQPKAVEEAGEEGHHVGSG